METKRDKNTHKAPNVRVKICFTDGLNFDGLKVLPVTGKDRENADRFSVEKDKIAHLISAYFKRKYVGNWTLNEYGKPISDDVFFNVSHSEKAVVIALSDSEVGIDIENVRPVKNSLKEYVSSDDELSFINSEEDFFKIWTAKESLVKAQGQGLKKDVKSVPAFPFDGEKEYLGEKYFSRQTRYNGYIITAVRKGKEPFELEIISEEIIKTPR